jgi:hypothetical protein
VGNAPFGKAIGLRRQRFEVGPVELFEQRLAGDSEALDRAFVVELPQQLADRRIAFGQTVEAAVAQAAEQPSLDNQHRDFDFRLVARPARPCRQDRGIVVGRPLGVGSIDLRLVETGLDDGHPRFCEGRLLVLSGTSRLGTPPVAAKARVWAPIQSASAWVHLGIEMLWGERRGQGIIVAGNNRRGAPCSRRMT